ncbi:MAG: hypothetical protein HC866_24450, partial [Leptolyngbyaceae cyanobacterium RU_5_1]|nr:hypothetical protein [Leptolyngbyaceae cyanobacterium RU_5_1]
WGYREQLDRAAVRLPVLHRVKRDRSLAQATPQTQPAPMDSPNASPFRTIPLPDQRQRVEDQTVEADYRVGVLQPDGQGSLWVGSWQGLARINPNTGQILARIGLPNATVGAIAQDRSGRTWVGTYAGLARIDPRTGTVTAQNLALPSNRVLSLLVDQRGYLWVGTDAGLALINPDRGLLMTTVQNLPGVSANALTLDVLGNLWVGTLEGLVQINTASAMIMRRITNLPGTIVQTLASSPWGMLWIGTPAGLLEADLGIKRSVEFVREPVVNSTTKAGTQRGQQKPRPAQSRKRNAAASKMSVRTKSTVPTQVRQQVVFSQNDPQVFRLRMVGQLSGRNVTTVQFDKANTIWVGTSTGLFRVNPFNGATGGSIPYLPSGRVLSLAPDTGGKLWVGTSEGLAWVNLDTFQASPHQGFSQGRP